jgi:hypothetical protein
LTASIRNLEKSREAPKAGPLADMRLTLLGETTRFRAERGAIEPLTFLDVNTEKRPAGRARERAGRLAPRFGDLLPRSFFNSARGSLRRSAAADEPAAAHAPFVGPA